MKRQLVEKDHPTLSLQKQSVLLELNRSSYYHMPKPESEQNQMLMKTID
jgi:putative transposase